MTQLISLLAFIDRQEYNTVDEQICMAHIITVFVMGTGEDHSRGGWWLKFSPILIGLLGVVAGAIVVTIYHLIAVGWCSQRRATGPPDHGHEGPHHQIQTSLWEEGGSSSTSNSIMAQLIPIIRYSKELEGDTCAVCLCEFKEAEQVRVLPECFHLFHVACVDTWLNSHSSCPLCRADTGGNPRAPEVELPPTGRRILKLCFI
ncbi:hypothetical protein FH972_017403 [Carpinus fangiana]|uniref:RING-type E3 ubiquitin transferase n=1 Tax=Carpinus fangiana TaxID=176857 RepID=A0A5N6RMC1_9ROSI|nr:hypothetical protein FH972_017403 [Carpinus fangiana]